MGARAVFLASDSLGVYTMLKLFAEGPSQLLALRSLSLSLRSSRSRCISPLARRAVCSLTYIPGRQGTMEL